MNTITELHTFTKKAEKLLGEAARAQLFTYLAQRPEAGALIEGTGGVRKLRWAREGKGKSGGVRVIYYFHSETLPLLMIDMYAKNEKENISKADKNTLATLVAEYVKSFRRKS